MNFATCTADSQQFYRAVTDTGLIALCPVPETAQLDYDCEGAVIIGTGGRRIPEADTLTHIAALPLCNEGTLHDWVRHAKFNVTQGNNWDGSGSLGPWIVPHIVDGARRPVHSAKGRGPGAKRFPSRFRRIWVCISQICLNPIPTERSLVRRTKVG